MTMNSTVPDHNNNIYFFNFEKIGKNCKSFPGTEIPEYCQNSGNSFREIPG